MFSVIIPVYNGEKFIRQAIECVRRQSFTAWELIIVNDGSRDGTARILDSYAGDARIRIIHQANGGVSAARNAAIAAANHDYLAFLDADDLWYDNHLQVLAELIEKYPDAGLYGTAAGVEFADGSRGDFTAFFNGKPDTLYLEDFFEAYARDTGAKCYNMNSNCFRREAALAGGCFREGCKIGEDLALSLWISAYYPVVLDRRVTTLYQRGNSTATRDGAFDTDWFFFEEAKALINDPAIPEEKRRNIARVMDWFQMRRSRHYMIEARRKEAIDAFRKIRNKRALGKDSLITAALLLMPCSLVRRIFAMRWRSKA